MFYCDECREKKNWPESLTMSIGPCEVCGKMRSCWDVKSSNLPIPEDKTKHTGIDCPICGREFFAGDIINTKNTKKLNSHDALLEALKKISDIEDARFTHAGFDLEVNNIAKHAIAQAQK